jgi:hypothetical protein
MKPDGTDVGMIQADSTAGDEIETLFPVDGLMIHMIPTIEIVKYSKRVTDEQC